MSEPPCPGPVIQGPKEIFDNFTHRTLSILKSTIVPLLPNRPHQTRGDQVPQTRRALPKPIPPSKKKLHDSIRKHPLYPKRLKNKTPNLPCHPTMQKQMIYSLLSILTHTTPALHHITVFLQVVTSKNPTPGHNPNKESNPPGSLDCPNTLPREALFLRDMKSIIEGTGVKSTSVIQLPSQLIYSLSLRDMRMKKGEKDQHLVQLPIIETPPKNDIPLPKASRASLEVLV